MLIRAICIIELPFWIKKCPLLLAFFLGDCSIGPLMFCAAFSAPTAPRSVPITTRRTSRRTAPIRSSPNDSMSIQEYIEEHALGKKVEDVINAAVKAKAAEPVSFMVRALPAISIFARHRSDDYRAAVSSRRGVGFGTGFARVFTTERSGRSSTPRNCRETTPRRSRAAPRSNAGRTSRRSELFSPMRSAEAKRSNRTCENRR